MRGRGLPRLDGSGKGDQYLQVTVSVPTHLSAEQKRLLAEFAKASGISLEEETESFTEKVTRSFKR